MNRIVIVILLLALVIGCSEKKEIKAPGVTSADETATAEIRPDQELRDARISLYNGPVKTTDVKADFMEKYEKLDSTLAWNLDVYFYDSLGKQMSHLIADSGLVREQLQMIEVFGNVHVDSHEGTSLITRHLLWNSPKNRVETDSFVTFVQPGGDTMRGYGFEADRNLNHWKIKHQSSGVMQNTDGIIE